MNLKMRAALLSAAGLLSVSALAGYGTYAMFTAQASNNNNFTAGTLNITPERDDIPQVGPMFYTSASSTQAGVVPTGLWAPGDQHTRGLFLENNGTLSARLTTLSAYPADANGNPLTSTSSDRTDYNNDLLFAQQSNVRIWQLVAVNPSSVNLSDPDDFSHGGNSTQIENAVDCINELYTNFLDTNSDADLSNPAVQQKMLNDVNHYLLQTVNDISATAANGQTVTSDSVQVVQMIDEPLINLINNSVNVSSLGDVIKPKHSSLLAFTVGFDKEAPGALVSQFGGSQTAADNSMQGKSVYFNFGTSWVQTRNNPNIIEGMQSGKVYPDSYLGSSNANSPAASGIWNVVNAGSSAVNGVPLVFSTQVYDSTGTLNVSFNTDDVSELYVDGRPRWIENFWNSRQNDAITVRPGYHLIQFFAENTDNDNQQGASTFQVVSGSPNPAVLNAVVTDGAGATLATTANPSQWSVQEPSGGPTTFDPYMFGSTTQSYGSFDSIDASYTSPTNSVTSGVPIGPAQLPQ